MTDLTPGQLAELERLLEEYLSALSTRPCRPNVDCAWGDLSRALYQSAPQLIAVARRTAEAERAVSDALHAVEHERATTDARIAELERHLTDGSVMLDNERRMHLVTIQEHELLQKRIVELDRQLAEAKALVDDVLCAIEDTRESDEPDGVEAEFIARRAALDAPPSDSEEKP